MIRVLDNILPAYEFKVLHDNIMQFDFPWCYGRKSIESNVITNPFLYGFVRVIINDGVLVFDPHRIIEPAVRLALGYAGEKVQSILRVRCILNTAADENYEFGTHIDLQQPHRTALIYLNDSDGDTIVYNERFSPTLTAFNGNLQIDDDTLPDLSIRQAVTPKANRMVIFDGHLYHSGRTPTTVSRRVAINVNYTTEEDIIPTHSPIQTLTLV
jgi:2OG-Fe(II) oxygenase superfamily